MRRTSAIAAVAAALVLVAASGYAQTTTASAPVTTTGVNRWDGFYASGSAGLWPRTFDIGASVEAVQQVSGANVPGRGIVVVPGTTATLPATSPSSTSLLAGIAAGYGIEFERWVGAIEAGLDFGFGSVSNTSGITLAATALTPAVPLTLVRSASADIGWSVRARAGYPWRDFLFYGTAGLAGARVKLEATDTWTNVPGGPGVPDENGISANLGPLGPYVTTVGESAHRIGFTFGVGAEKSLSDTLSVGAEYRRTDFGTADFSMANPSVAIDGPLPATGSNAQALPGPTTVGFADNRLLVRVSLKLNFER